jgi:hypothetical protein
MNKFFALCVAVFALSVLGGCGCDASDTDIDKNEVDQIFVEKETKDPVEEACGSFPEDYSPSTAEEFNQEYCAVKVTLNRRMNGEDGLFGYAKVPEAIDAFVCFHLYGGSEYPSDFTGYHLNKHSAFDALFDCQYHEKKETECSPNKYARLAKKETLARLLDAFMYDNDLYHDLDKENIVQVVAIATAVGLSAKEQKHLKRRIVLRSSSNGQSHED